MFSGELMNYLSKEDQKWFDNYVRESDNAGRFPKFFIKVSLAALDFRNEGISPQMDDWNKDDVYLFYLLLPDFK
jgi:hypothetical protein